MGINRIKGSTDVLAEVNASEQLEVSVENEPTIKIKAGEKVKITDGTDDADVITLENSSTNLDGLKGIVGAVVAHGRIGDADAHPLKMDRPSGDSLSTTGWRLATNTFLNTIADGGNVLMRAKSKTSDGGNIANNVTGCVIVINLNYVWNSVASRWEPMKQPAIV